MKMKWNRRMHCPNFCIVLMICSLPILAGCGLRHGTGGQLTTRFVDAVGPSEREVYDVGNFSAIELRGNGRVKLVRGSPGVAIEGARNQIDLVSVRVEENTLIVEPSQRVSFHPEIDIEIAVSRLSSFQSYGSFQLHTVGTPLDGGIVNLEIKGNGNYRFLINARRIDVVHNGFGKVELTGLVDTLNANVNATGGFDSRNLLADVTSIEVNGVGNAFVYAGESLTARANGIGSITYRGSPRSIDTKGRGIGNISARQ